jgi:hypothetical protein
MIRTKRPGFLTRLFGGAELRPTVDAAPLQSLLALAWVVEARDPYTGGHLWRVSRYANLLAQRAGHSAKEVAVVTMGGFLHDLGKIAVPDAVLRKTGRLTDDEYDVIKTHPEVGRQLLSRHPLGEFVMDAVYGHHERPDGKGYPLGIEGDRIAPMSAIVGICDAFDAMTSARPYRKPMPVEHAFDIVRANLGTQFHRKYGELFLELGAEPDLHHVVGHSDDGIPLQHCLACGPTIVVRQDRRPGMTVFCPACTSAYRFHDLHEALEPTGESASASDLVSAPDEALLSRFAERLAWPV